VFIFFEDTVLRSPFLFCAFVATISSAGAQEMALVLHNGSLAIFTRDDRHQVEIRYEQPRPGLPVAKGTLLFSGTYDNKRGYYSGTAYTFKQGCDPAPYAVSGKDSGPGIVLVGIAPHRDPHSCAVIGDVVSGKNSRLVFEFEPEN
jgi:hypothetical protein